MNNQPELLFILLLLLQNFFNSTASTTTTTVNTITTTTATTAAAATTQTTTATNITSWCRGRYCLYFDDNYPSKTYRRNETAAQCSTINNGSWLLEVYDENVSSLLEEFVGNYTNLVNKSILLGTRLVYNESWFWMNKKIAGSINTTGFTNPDKTMAGVHFINYSYFNRSPQEKFNALCYIETSPNCTQQNSWSSNSSCYFPLFGTYTWYEAHYECTEEGGSLAVFDELDLKNVNQTWVNSALNNASYWVGLTKTLLLWNQTDSLVNYTKWANNYPTNLTANQCIRIRYENHSSNGTWEDVACDASIFTVVCMSENLQPTTSLTSNTTSEYSGLKQNQQIGIGVGVSLFILMLLLVVVLGVVCARRNKLLCCKKRNEQQRQSKQQNLDNQSTSYYSNDDDKIVYAAPNATTTNNTSNQNSLQYADLQFSQNKNYNKDNYNGNNSNNYDNNNNNNYNNDENDVYYNGGEIKDRMINIV